MTYTILQISDLHLSHISANPARWMGCKPFLGMSNLVLRRRFKFKAALLKQVVSKMLEFSADLVLVTGDLTTTGQEVEFERARDILLPLSIHADVLKIIPGNHDRYTKRVIRKQFFETHFGDDAYPRCEDFEFADGAAVRLIGIETCKPRVISSKGHYFERQSQELSRLLSEGKQDGKLLIVMAHYPFAYPDGSQIKWNHGLGNKGALLKILIEHPPDLYFHGHTHEVWGFYPDPLPSVLCINGGSASRASDDGGIAAGFNRIICDEGKISIIRHYIVNKGWESNIILETGG